LTNRLNATPVARDMHLYSDSNCLEIYCWTLLDVSAVF